VYYHTHAPQQPTAANAATALAIAADILSRHRECEPRQIERLNAAVETVIAASPQAAEAYCSAIRHIVWDIGAFKKNPNKASIETVQHVIAAMTAHIGDETVQCKGAAAVASIAWENPENVRNIIDIGGLEALYAAADAHAASAHLQLHVCYAMYMIARDAHGMGAATLREGGQAVEIAARIRHTHTDDHDLIRYAACLCDKLAAT